MSDTQDFQDKMPLDPKDFATTATPSAEDQPEDKIEETVEKPKEKEEKKKKKKKKENGEHTDTEKAEDATTDPPPKEASKEAKDDEVTEEMGEMSHSRTIIFIRHGEKPDATDDIWGNLSDKGRLRGKYLVDLFGIEGSFWLGQDPYRYVGKVGEVVKEQPSETRPLLQHSMTSPPDIDVKKSKKAKLKQLGKDEEVQEPENPFLPVICRLPSGLMDVEEIQRIDVDRLNPEYQNVTLFPVSTKESTAMAPIRYIFASKPNEAGTSHLRMVQTVKPLLDHLNLYAKDITDATDDDLHREHSSRYDYVPKLKIDTRFEIGDVKEIAQAIKDLPERLDPILVCWEHKALEEIAHHFVTSEALKATTKHGKKGKLKWSDDDFDSVWVVRDGKIEFRWQDFDVEKYKQELKLRDKYETKKVIKEESGQVKGCCEDLCSGCNTM